jgi:hypothetical protein
MMVYVPSGVATNYPRGLFRAIPYSQLERAIYAWLAGWNHTPKPLV